MPKRSKVTVHGKLSSYAKGCRCKKCQAARRAYYLQYSARWKKPKPPPRECVWCGETFQPAHIETVLCSSKCRSARWRSANRLPRALISEWYIEPDPDLAMLQAIAAQQEQ